MKGRIDYERLREQFGTQPVTPELLAKVHHIAGGDLPPALARGIYYSHRDLPALLDGFANGKPFFLYSGRGPSGPLHTSHLLQFSLCQWFQKRLGVPMYIQITDDEKFWSSKSGLSRDETVQWGLENLTDILALGFDPKRTFTFFDSKSIAAMYPLAVRIARKIPYSTVKAVFGFEPSQNIGLVFYTALQTVPAFWPSWAEGRSVPFLIPFGIDLVPHLRVSRVFF